MSTITRKRGDDYSIFLNLTDGAKAPLDITGSGFVLSTSSSREPAAAAYEFQITGVISGAPTLGVVEFPFDSGKADSLGKFYYDIEMTDAGGKIRTVDDGVLIFTQDIGK